MHKKLSSKLSKLSDKTEKLMNQLDGENLEILQKKPDENSWSVIQILNHLMVSESSSLNYVKKKILGIDTVGKVGVSARARMLAMNLAFNGKRKFKAPVYVDNPSNSDDLQQIKERWRELRGDLNTFLEDFPDEYIEKVVYRHPISGRVSTSQMIDFFIMHMRHHVHQVNRTLLQVKS